jgi:hypothetical protein
LHDVEWRRWAWRAIPLSLIVGPPLCLFGCTSPTAPPAVPSGGQQLVMNFNQFASTVEPVLMAKGCDATADCHGGGIRGTFQLSPPSAKDVHFDFDQASLQVWVAYRDSSPILRKPLALAAGGVPHSFKPFATTADSGYLAIRAWVDSGVVQ